MFNNKLDNLRKKYHITYKSIDSRKVCFVRMFGYILCSKLYSKHKNKELKKVNAKIKRVG